MSGTGVPNLLPPPSTAVTAKVPNTEYAVVQFVSPVEEVKIQVSSLYNSNKFGTVSEMFSEINQENENEVRRFIGHIHEQIVKIGRANDELSFDLVNLQESSEIAKYIFSKDVQHGNQYQKVIAAHAKVKIERNRKDEALTRFFNGYNYRKAHVPAWTTREWWFGLAHHLMEPSSSTLDKINAARGNGKLGNWTPMELMRRMSYTSILRQAGIRCKRTDTHLFRPVDVDRALDKPDEYDSEGSTNDFEFQKIIKDKQFVLDHGIYWRGGVTPPNYHNLAENEGIPGVPIRREPHAHQKLRANEWAGMGSKDRSQIRAPVKEKKKEPLTGNVAPVAPTAPVAPVAPANSTVFATPGISLSSTSQNPIPSTGTMPTTNTNPLPGGAPVNPERMKEVYDIEKMVLRERKPNPFRLQEIENEEFDDEPLDQTEIGLQLLRDVPGSGARWDKGKDPSGRAQIQRPAVPPQLPGNLQGQSRPGPGPPPDLVGPNAGQPRTIVQTFSVPDRSKIGRSSSVGRDLRPELHRSLATLSMNEARQMFNTPKRGGPTPTPSMSAGPGKRLRRQPTPDQIATQAIGQIASPVLTFVSTKMENSLPMTNPVKNPDKDHHFAWGLIRKWAQERMIGSKPPDLTEEEVQVIVEKGDSRILQKYRDILEAVKARQSSDFTTNNFIYFLVKSCIERCEELARSQVEPEGVEVDIAQALADFWRQFRNMDMKIRSGNMYNGGVMVSITNLEKLERAANTKKSGWLDGTTILAGIAVIRGAQADNYNVIPEFDWANYIADESKPLKFWGSASEHIRFVIVWENSHWWCMMARIVKGEIWISALDSLKSRDGQDSHVKALNTYARKFWPGKKIKFTGFGSNRQGNDYDCGMWVIENFKAVHKGYPFQDAKVSWDSRTNLIEEIGAAVKWERNNGSSLPPRPKEGRVEELMDVQEKQLAEAKATNALALKIAKKAKALEQGKKKAPRN